MQLDGEVGDAHRGDGATLLGHRAEALDDQPCEPGFHGDATQHDDRPYAAPPVQRVPEVIPLQGLQAAPEVDAEAAFDAMHACEHYGVEHARHHQAEQQPPKLDKELLHIEGQELLALAEPLREEAREGLHADGEHGQWYADGIEVWRSCEGPILGYGLPLQLLRLHVAHGGEGNEHQPVPLGPRLRGDENVAAEQRRHEQAALLEGLEHVGGDEAEHHDLHIKGQGEQRAREREQRHPLQGLVVEQQPPLPSRGCRRKAHDQGDDGGVDRDRRRVQGLARGPAMYHCLALEDGLVHGGEDEQAAERELEADARKSGQPTR
mmetsp:Transcript_110720/g.319847  ORF Transcript_110720/g.319847 Transcript_110720/m.319847 type:complete len:321 (+) Transcript_110720:349-1311(+)